MGNFDKIVNLCKNRGFIFPGSDIYDGLANTWDYGPVGVEIKNNIKHYDRLLDVDEVSELLKKSVSTIYRMTHEKEIPHIKCLSLFGRGDGI